MASSEINAVRNFLLVEVYQTVFVETTMYAIFVEEKKGSIVARMRDVMKGLSVRRVNVLKNVKKKKSFQTAHLVWGLDLNLMKGVVLG